MAALTGRAWEHPGFKIRSTALIIDNGRVLVHTIGPTIDWWALPGGGPAFQELTAQTLTRELDEELGCDATVADLRFVIEHAFRSRRSGDLAHHLDFVYRARIDDRDLLSRTEPWVGPRPESYGELVFHWLPLEEIAGPVPLFPEVLHPYLADTGGPVMHLCHRQDT
ncbi:MAG: NUDIX domain-containing protein [Microthrixaceae bacterium]